jgi:putative membrane protein
MSDERRDDSVPHPRVIEIERDVVTLRTDTLSPRVIATDATSRIVPVAPPAKAGAARPAQPRRKRPLITAGLAAIGVFLVGGLALGTVDWVTSLFERSAALGALAAALLASGVSGAGLIAWYELSSLFMLESVERIQRRLSPEASPREAQGAIDDLIAVLARRRDSEAGIAAFQRQVLLHHSPAEQVEILRQTVIRPIDQRAEAVIRKTALRAFGITALSPTSLTDALFFLALSLRMTREISEAYGLRPTAATTIHLVRRLLREAGTLGAIDLATASLMQHLGGGAAERLSSAAAESLYAAQRITRLGIAIMQLTRPVPFAPQELPTLSSLVGGLFRGRGGVERAGAEG